MDTTKRFSSRVENYALYRPHYPEAILSFLKEKINFSPALAVADIGSGTGISTEMFLQNGNIVFAVEPNQPMREKAEELLNQYSNFHSINGTAEQSGLDDKSIQLIVAGQAFHWFDIPKAKKEFQRMLSNEGLVLLIWNERKVSSGLEKDYEQLLQTFGTDYAAVDHRNINVKIISKFYYPHRFINHTFYNQQFFDYEGLKGRLLSCSYIPDEQNENYQLMMNALKQLYGKYKSAGKVKFEYETKIYLGRV